MIDDDHSPAAGEDPEAIRSLIEALNTPMPGYDFMSTDALNDLYAAAENSIRCAPLLPPPGDAVVTHYATKVRELIDEIRVHRRRAVQTREKT